MSPPDDGAVRRVLQPLGDPRQRLLQRAAAGEVEALGGEGPLAQVDVLVPQSGDQPPAVRGVLLGPGRASETGADLGDPAVPDEDVDGFGRRHGIDSHGHDACAAHEEAGHGANAR